MSRVYQGSPGGPLRRMYTTSSTQATLGTPARVPTTTKPAADGVVDLSLGPPAWLRLFPFGVGANNTTFDCRLWGWSPVGTLWVPSILLQFTATLSQAVGVAGSDVLATDRFADTLGDPATNLGAKGTDCQPHSPQNDTPGFYLVDAAGNVLFELETALGTATAGNGLLGPA